MNSFGKPVQKHYRFPFFSLPREVRDIIYQALFVSDDFVHYYHLDTFSCMPELYEILENVYEATTSLRFLQESLETFFRDNVFLVSVHAMPFLLKYRRLSLRSMEQMALPPYIPEEANKMSITWELGRRPVTNSAGDGLHWVLDDKSKFFMPPCHFWFEDEENVPDLRKMALEMSTWIRSIHVPTARLRCMKFPEPCLLELCKLPNLQHVSIMTRIDRWPLLQSGQPAAAAAAACLKELRSRFGKGFELVYYSKKEKRQFQVPDSFINLLCALSDTREEENEWEEDWSDTGESESEFVEDWLEEQFHPLE